MTKQEAIEAIRNGHKVAHTYFTPDEYIYLKNSEMYFEGNVLIPTDWWDKDYLQDGWNLHHSETNNKVNTPEKEIHGYVVLGAGVDKVEAAKTLLSLAEQTGDVAIVNSVEHTELITEEEAKSINPDIYTIEQYDTVVKEMTKMLVEKSVEKAKNQFGKLPRRLRRSIMKGDKPKRVLKKLSTVNYVTDLKK